jgi:hypothetical protein
MPSGKVRLTLQKIGDGIGDPQLGLGEGRHRPDGARAEHAEAKPQ